MFRGPIRLSSHFRSFTSTISMQSAPGRSRRYYSVKRSKTAGPMDQALVVNGGRQMSSAATAMAPIPQSIVDEPKPSVPTHKESRHFTDKKFADAAISPASKQGISHESVVLNRSIMSLVLNLYLGLCPMFKVRAFLAA